MGFSAFGGGAANNRSKQRKTQQQTGKGASASQWPPAQVVPGTELGEQLLHFCDSARLEHGAHGVTFLVSAARGGDVQNTSGTRSLASLLSSPRIVGQDDHRAFATTKLLPARCYQLLDELQQEKNQ